MAARSVRMENTGRVVIPVGGVALLDLLDSVLEEEQERPIVWHYIRGTDWWAGAGATVVASGGGYPTIP